MAHRYDGRTLSLLRLARRNLITCKRYFCHLTCVSIALFSLQYLMQPPDIHLSRPLASISFYAAGGASIVSSLLSFFYRFLAVLILEENYQAGGERLLSIHSVSGLDLCRNGISSGRHIKSKTKTYIPSHTWPIMFVRFREGMPNPMSVPSSYRRPWTS